MSIAVSLETEFALVEIGLLDSASTDEPRAVAQAIEKLLHMISQLTAA